MKRIKARYVAQVVLDFDMPRTSETFPLEKIRHLICDGDMKNAITRALHDGVEACTVTVDQQYADVYEVEEGDGMKLNSEQTVVCNVFSRRDKTGHVHCHDCPMVIDSRYAICLGTVTKEDARKYHDWNGSPYPALGDYEGGQEE